MKIHRTSIYNVARKLYLCERTIENFMEFNNIKINYRYAKIPEIFIQFADVSKIKTELGWRLKNTSKYG